LNVTSKKLVNIASVLEKSVSNFNVWSLGYDNILWNIIRLYIKVNIKLFKDMKHILIYVRGVSKEIYGVKNKKLILYIDNKNYKI
jgi:hypothetical protein